MNTPGQIPGPGRPVDLGPPTSGGHEVQGVRPTNTVAAYPDYAAETERLATSERMLWPVVSGSVGR
jgi:hypothetical protein